MLCGGMWMVGIELKSEQMRDVRARDREEWGYIATYDTNPTVVG